MKILVDFYDEIEEEVRAGNVEKVFRDDLVLFRYTQKCHHKNNWNKVTLRCRGLIVDCTTRTVVGRPFDKFFNLNDPVFPENSEEELRKAVRTQGHWASEKIDGTMITIFFAEDRWQCATHRSLSGPHVDSANDLLEKKDYIFAKGYTFVCEYTAPWDRKVIDYGEKEDFTLLSVHHTTWLPSICAPKELEVIAKCMGIGIPENVRVNKDFANLRVDPYTEGYVLLFDNGHRVKVKTEWYLAAHKFIDMPEKRIIKLAKYEEYIPEALEKKRREEICKTVQAVRDLKEDVLREVESAWIIIAIMFTGDTGSIWRPDKDLYKDVACVIKKHQDWMQPCLFALMRGKSMVEMVWKETERRYRNVV